MMWTRASLIEQLLQLGLTSGDLVMLHVSMRAIGPILGGPDELLQAIKDVISPDGTLMMYVGCEPEYEAVGREKYAEVQEQFIETHCPPCNFATARARRDYGMMAEFFRTWPGTQCSQNPGARIAANGKNAQWLVEKHSINYGYGPNSPLDKLYQKKGKLLLLGSDLDQVTVLHYAEHIAPINEKRIARFKVPLLQNNHIVWTNIEEFDTSFGIRQWPDRFFATIVGNYLYESQIKAQQIGSASSYLLDVKSLVDFAIPTFVAEAEKYPC